MASGRLTMKLLVFAHTPPPHHGQSYMVELMLKNFGGDRRNPANQGNPAYGIDCYHVNARFSQSLEKIGEFQAKKLLLVLCFCAEAIWCRFRHGVTNFYYIPAPGKRVAVFRDWLILFLCRPFFKRTIYHWHAAGLAKWLETSVQMPMRIATYHCFKGADLSVVISNYNVADAAKLRARNIRVVSNGIPDPCPDFGTRVEPRRRARLAVRRRLLSGAQPTTEELAHAGEQPHIVRVLFLAHCSHEKGFFAAAQAVKLANATLSARRSTLQFKLYAGGSFASESERKEFQELSRQPGFAGTVEQMGFISGAVKDRALAEADIFCFPTVYLGENQPVNLIEAMAFGLPVLTTRWRSLPEMFPPGYPGLVNSQDAEIAAAALLQLITSDAGRELRENFLARFTLENHLRNLAAAMHEVESSGQPTSVPAKPAAALG